MHVLFLGLLATSIGVNVNARAIPVRHNQATGGLVARAVGTSGSYPGPHVNAGGPKGSMRAKNTDEYNEVPIVGGKPSAPQGPKALVMTHDRVPVQDAHQTSKKAQMLGHAENTPGHVEAAANFDFTNQYIKVLAVPADAPEPETDSTIPPPAKLAITKRLRETLKRSDLSEEVNSALVRDEESGSNDVYEADDNGGRRAVCARAPGKTCAGGAVKRNPIWWNEDGSMKPLYAIPEKHWSALWKEFGERGALKRKELDSYIYHQRSRIDTLPAEKRPVALSVHYNVDKDDNVKLETNYGQVNSFFRDSGAKDVDFDVGSTKVRVTSKVKPKNEGLAVLTIGANVARRALVTFFAFTKYDGNAKEDQMFSSEKAWQSWVEAAGDKAAYLQHEEKHHVINNEDQNAWHLAHLYHPDAVDQRAIGTDGKEMDATTGRGVWTPSHPAYNHLLVSPNHQQSVNMVMDHGTGMVFPYLVKITTFPSRNKLVSPSMKDGQDRHGSVVINYGLMPGAAKRTKYWQPKLRVLGQAEVAAIPKTKPEDRPKNVFDYMIEGPNDEVVNVFDFMTSDPRKARPKAKHFGVFAFQDQDPHEDSAPTSEDEVDDAELTDQEEEQVHDIFKHQVSGPAGAHQLQQQHPNQPVYTYKLPGTEKMTYSTLNANIRPEYKVATGPSLDSPATSGLMRTLPSRPKAPMAVAPPAREQQREQQQQPQRERERERGSEQVGESSKTKGSAGKSKAPKVTKTGIDRQGNIVKWYSDGTKKTFSKSRG